MPLKAMAVKSKAQQSGSRKAAAAPKNEDQDKQATETQERDSPLLDLSDQAVKKLIKHGQGARLRHL